MTNKAIAHQMFMCKHTFWSAVQNATIANNLGVAFPLRTINWWPLNIVDCGVLAEKK